MVRIVADSTCDLPENIVKEYAMTVVPLHIVLGDDEYRDGTEISPKEIFKWCDENDTTPKTSAVSYDDTMKALEPIAASGDEAIVFVISESMSTTGNVFRMVIEDLEAEERIFVFDSQNLSAGIGLLAMKAADMAKDGLAAQVIISRLESLRGRVRASFVLDSLSYLAKGGRCSSITALAGGVLKIHPKIVVKDGAMEADKRYRGQMKAVVMDYVRDMQEELLNACKDRAYLVYAGVDEAIIEEVREHLESLNIFDSILMGDAGGVISSHCGPGTLGVMFIEGE